MPKEKFTGKTTKDAGHDHKFVINEEGDGKTSWDAGHDHKILKNEIEVVNKHKHELPSKKNRFKKLLKEEE